MQRLVGREGRGGVHVVDAGDSHSQKVRLGHLQSRRHLLHIGSGNRREDDLHRRLEQHPIGCATRETLQMAVLWIGRLRRDAGQAQRSAVGDGGMRALGDQHDGMAWGHIVQCRRRGKDSAGPEVLVPAAPLNPHARRSLRCPFRHPLRALLPREVPQVKVVQAQRVPHQVQVGIHQAGKHRRAVQISDNCAGRVGPGQRLVVQRDYPFPHQGDSRRPRMGRASGVNMDIP